MSSFDELLADIRARDQNNDGKLFEVFCKWFLENDPEWSKVVHKVWLWADYPISGNGRTLGRISSLKTQTAGPGQSRLSVTPSIARQQRRHDSSW